MALQGSAPAVARKFVIEILVTPSGKDDAGEAFRVANVLWLFSERLKNFGVLYDVAALKDSCGSYAGRAYLEKPPALESVEPAMPGALES